MDSDLAKAQHFRDQANQMRELAGGEENLEARKGLMELSEMYDRLYRKALERAENQSS
jgi:hypothetical protein